MLSMSSAVVLAIAIALVAPAAAVPMNSTTLANLFINLGNQNPTASDCKTYASLFLPTGELHSPGIPDASGTDALMSACKESFSKVDPLLSFQELNIPVMSWNTEKRAAFRWTINGVRAKDGSTVSADAITGVLADSNWKIQKAWSFYDDQEIDPPTGMTEADRFVPPFDPTQLVHDYITLGAPNKGSKGTTFDCTKWAQLFTVNGTNNEPGFPPNMGLTKLEKLCNTRAAVWDLYTASAQLVLPVMAWNTNKRVAFKWTIAARAKGETNIRVIPAITMLFMTPKGGIIDAWDFWDQDLLPTVA
eukprot:m.294153 g.294153  ORF g.294153 m.294153 type:complete len:304 (-) comp19501_c8_seq2:217-1128(-)